VSLRDAPIRFDGRSIDGTELYKRDRKRYPMLSGRNLAPVATFHTSPTRSILSATKK
jgi:hypothetical protein